MADDDEDALYGLPLEEFVPARDALAREAAAREAARRRGDDRRAREADPPGVDGQPAGAEEGALVAKLSSARRRSRRRRTTRVEGKGAAICAPPAAPNGRPSTG